MPRYYYCGVSQTRSKGTAHVEQHNKLYSAIRCARIYPQTSDNGLRVSFCTLHRMPKSAARQRRGSAYRLPAWAKGRNPVTVPNGWRAICWWGGVTESELDSQRSLQLASIRDNLIGHPAEVCAEPALTTERRRGWRTRHFLGGKDGDDNRTLSRGQSVDHGGV